MPQEIRVLKCYKCAMFQTDIVKKSKNWLCKMCGEKQSVMQEFGRGSGKECRLHAQKLNEQKYNEEILKDETIFDNICNNNGLPVNNGSTQTTASITMPLTIDNKWTKYIDEEKTNTEDSHGDILFEASVSEEIPNITGRKPVKRLSSSTGNCSKTKITKTVSRNPVINNITPRTKNFNISAPGNYNLEPNKDFSEEQKNEDSVNHIESGTKKHSVQNDNIQKKANSNCSKWSEFIDESSNGEI